MSGFDTTRASKATLPRGAFRRLFWIARGGTDAMKEMRRHGPNATFSN
jgi:hypothetical protein